MSLEQYHIVKLIQQQSQQLEQQKLQQTLLEQQQLQQQQIEQQQLDHQEREKQKQKLEQLTLEEKHLKQQTSDPTAEYSTHKSSDVLAQTTLVQTEKNNFISLRKKIMEEQHRIKMLKEEV